MGKPRFFFDNILCKVTTEFFEKAVGGSLHGVVVALDSQTLQFDEVFVVLDPCREDDCISEIEMHCVVGPEPELKPFLLVSFKKFLLLQLETINPVLRRVF